MHPILLAHDWMVTHPIGFPLLLFFAAVPVSIYAAEIKSLLKVPPQEAGLWVLKARILANQVKFIRWHRMKTEPSYAISLLLAPAAFCFGVLLLYAVDIYGTLVLKDGRNSHVEHSLVLVTILPVFVLYYVIRDFNGALKRPDALPSLQLKIEKLQSLLPTEEPRQ